MSENRDLEFVQRIIRDAKAEADQTIQASGEFLSRAFAQGEIDLNAPGKCYVQMTRYAQTCQDRKTVLEAAELRQIFLLVKAFYIKSELPPLNHLKDPEGLLFMYELGYFSCRADVAAPDGIYFAFFTDVLHRHKSSGGASRQWEEEKQITEKAMKDAGLEEAIAHAKSQWSNGSKRMHNQMASHLLSLKQFSGLKNYKSKFLKRLKEVAEPYGRVRGLPKPPDKN